MTKDQKAKVQWFMLRTGATEDEAIEFLKQSKFKLEIAIRLRNAHYERLRQKL